MCHIMRFQTWQHHSFRASDERGNPDQAEAAAEAVAEMTRPGGLGAKDINSGGFLLVLFYFHYDFMMNSCGCSSLAIGQVVFSRSIE